MSTISRLSSGLRLLPIAATLLAGGCAADSYAQGYDAGYAPTYPPGYDNGMGSGQVIQPGDLFGGQNVQSIDAFFEPLAQYGEWVDSRYGRAFLPNAPQGWRPYVNGQWGENRLWISDDPWGWATDHYGRWGFDERINAWVWVPGTEWAPSWVAWREADGADGQVVGWAPVPPNVSYSFSVGFGSGFGYDNWNNWYQPSWVWVPSAYLYQPRFGGRVLPWSYGRNYWGGSRWNWNSGWNGRPGYGQWNGNYGRPGGNYGRPGNGGRPGSYGRPGQPAIGGAIGGGIAGVPQRPGQGGNWQGRPNNGNGSGGFARPRPDTGNWQGRPPGQPAVGGAIGGGIAGVPQRPAYGNNGGNWQGRPQGQPNGNYGRPRPDGSQPGSNAGGGNWAGRPQGTPPAGYGGRPAYQGNGVGGAIAGGMTQRPMPQMQRQVPQVQQQVPQMQRQAPPPQVQSQRQAPPPQQRNNGGGMRRESQNERPQ
jgi:hypothetical protein